MTSEDAAPTGSAPPPEPPRPGRASPSDIDPADLSILLGPRHRRWFARWGERGHGDPTLIAGRSALSYVHVLALVLAAGADVGAFDQIVQQILIQQSTYVVFVVVLGFTATVLYIAHASGVMFRDRRAGTLSFVAILPWICALTWLGLGVIAFFVRKNVLAATSTGSQTISLNGAHTTGSTSSSTQLEAALLFLALYVATGLVAGLGGYLAHNPLRAGYSTAARAYRRASERMAATNFEADAAHARSSAYEAELAAAAQTLEYEIHARLALAEKLKQYARVLVAQQLKDPAATDAIFIDDWRPYVPPSPYGQDN